ncbi:MAG: hypothetical protein E7233_01930 [Lachnospiraceae bacterium]|nr:hypothetical protein [Lachnospiraceae bacterium]
MGRKNNQYSLSLHQQIRTKLLDMLKAGEGRSKKADKENENTKGHIYSFSTYETYLKHCNYFARWINQKHPDCTTLKKAKKYINEYLYARCEQVNADGRPLSAWTIQTEAAALNKLFGIDKADVNRFQAPARYRENIIRSRVETETDKHFSKTNNAELIEFCKGTGCRRGVLEKLERSDYWTRDNMIQKVAELKNKPSKTTAQERMLADLTKALRTFPAEKDFLHHRKDKGGKYRFAPILGSHKEQIISRMLETESGKKVWGHVSNAADIHGYRGDYANRTYKKYARDIKDIPYDRINKGSGKKYQSEVYVCRGDERGKRLDKKAMEKASIALGHNRICVISDNYLRGI